MSRTGRHAEHKFSELCSNTASSYGTVINRSQDDQHGWDHIVEVSLGEPESLPADLRRPILQCFAQIKSTTKRRPSAKIKLTNALKAVYTASPCFIFLLSYAEDGSLKKVYGKHIWENEIEHWLRRAREHQCLSEAELSKKVVSVSFSDDDIVSGHLVDWIVEKVQSVNQSYSTEKEKIRDNAGYGERTHHGHIALGEGSGIVEFIEHQLGLIPDLPVKDFKLFDERFDIRSVGPIAEAKDGRITITPHGQPVSVWAEHPLGERVSFGGRAFFPGGVEPDDPNYAFSCVAEGLRLIVRRKDGKATINVEVEHTEKGNLRNIANYFQFLNWAYTDEVRVEVEGEYGVLFGGNIQFHQEKPYWLEQISNSSQFLITIIGEAEAEKVDVDLFALDSLNKEIHLISNIVSAPSIRFSAQFDSTIDHFSEICGYFYGKIEGLTYGFLFELPDCRITQEGSDTNIYSRSPRVLKRFFNRRGVEKMRDQLSDEFKKIKASKEQRIGYFFEGDAVKLVDALQSDGLLSLDVD